MATSLGRALRALAPLAALLATGCATPALHVVGVYEGALPSGVEAKPWWANCKADSGDASGKVPEPALVGCYARHAATHLEREVVVRISDDSRPIVLALTAYDRTHWLVRPTPGVEITKVILGGYHAQRVTGLPDATPIEVYTYDPSPCAHCFQGAGYFYSYRGPPVRLGEITKLDVTSFQGRYSGGEFSIFPGMKKLR